MKLSQNKVRSLLKLSLLAEISLGWHLRDVCNVLGLPEGFKSLEEIQEQIPTLEEEAEGPCVVLSFKAIEMYFLKGARTLEYFVVDKDCFTTTGLPKIMSDNGWYNFFGILFAVKHQEITSFADNNSFSIRDITGIHSDYPKYVVENSRTILSFCGKGGEQGLCSLAVDRYVSKQNE